MKKNLCENTLLYKQVSFGSVIVFNTDEHLIWCLQLREESNPPLIVNKVQGLVTTFSVVFITIMLHDELYRKKIIGVYFSAYSISLLRIYLLLYYS